MRTVCLAIFLGFLLGACGSVVKNPTPLDAPEAQVSVPAREYRIGVGDQLDIQFPYHPEFNRLPVPDSYITVRPDGRISMPLIGAVNVAGLTPEELSQVLKEKYRPELREPEINVLVHTFSTQKVFVDGEVGKPGLIDLLGNMTMLQSIAMAGGLTPTARRKEIIIIRRGADNKPITMTVNADEVINGARPNENILLKPFDIVYVPRSAIANVNLWVDQYIRKNIPITISTGFYVTGTATAAPLF
jgi:protein involved in polysaccharide export with SLBB domain